jgi:hypothetical protein
MKTRKCGVLRCSALNQGKENDKMKLLEEHLFCENCEEENHNNWECLLDDLVWDGEAIEYYEEQNGITRIDEWIEKTFPFHYFRATVFRHNPTGQYYWYYEDLKGGDGSYSGSEDYSWIELGEGTIQNWIGAVKDKKAVIEELP